jgi:hypothetical protein
MNIKKFIDLHMHIGPEIIPRRFTLPQLIEEEQGRITGIGVKNHFYQTTPIINTLDVTNKPLIIGSVVLNNYVGGLNPDVVYSTAKLSERPIIVWFPTINAENFLKKSKYEIRPEWAAGKFKSRLSKDVKGIRVIDSSMNLNPMAKKVLREIKDNDCILATGHLSWQEAKTLVYEALAMGIDRIIITHPMYQLINMPMEIQKELANNKGVYLEHSYSMHLIDGIPIKAIAESIKEAGPEKCIISSDVGQVNRPSPSRALAEFTRLLKSNGIENDSLTMMGETTPKKLIQG